MFASELKCIRTDKDADQKCEDCSSLSVYVIVCPACASSCHKGHSLSSVGTKRVCRCPHKHPAVHPTVQTTSQNENEEATVLLPQFVEKGERQGETLKMDKTKQHASGKIVIIVCIRENNAI